jgi:hypothetical protein
MAIWWALASVVCVALICRFIWAAEDKDRKEDE